MKFSSIRGQSLIELLVGITVGVLFIVAALGIITLTLRIDFSNTRDLTGNELASELINNVETFANADWHNLSSLSLAQNYYLDASGGFFASVLGSQSITINGQEFTRSFLLEPAYRDGTTDLLVSFGDPGAYLDQSTFLVNVTVSWIEHGDTDSTVIKRYVTRYRNRLFYQDDWTSGSGQEQFPGGGAGLPSVVNDRFTTSTDANASTSILIADFSDTPDPTQMTNIDSGDKWAWNDVIGWIDFRITNTVTVTSTHISGYASTSIGYVAFDCATTPNLPDPDICSTSNFRVDNDGIGNLSGWAWNDGVGWISFSGTSPDYQVSIDGFGYFHGWAWSDAIGWISFNCENTGSCGTADYKVRTFWNTTPSVATLTSSIYDTGRSLGAGFNTILWQGSLPSGTDVKFKVAVSNNLSGPWTDSDFVGSDGTDTSYYLPLGPDSQVHLDDSLNNYQYIRYRAFLYSDPNHTVSPRIDDVIINWSY